jgi:hypothetical protein
MAHRRCFIGSVLETSGTDEELWKDGTRWNKVFRIRRSKPCYYIILAEDDMVDIARIRHS